MSQREIRVAGGVAKAEAREGQQRTIVGYAAVFDSAADIGGMFREQIARGAFSAAIGRDDVRALFNHDENYVLGRTTNGTLAMTEDETGLRVEITPPDTAWARDLLVSIERGDVSQMSFAFRATKEQWDETVEPPLRTILEAELYDVSPVTYPAYTDTEVGVRSLGEWRAAHKQKPKAPTASVQRKRLALDLRARGA